METLEDRNEVSLPSYLKRSRVAAVRDFPEGCGVFEARVQLGKREDHDTVIEQSDNVASKIDKVYAPFSQSSSAANSMPTRNCFPPRKLMKGIYVERDFPFGCGRLESSCLPYLAKDKECEHFVKLNSTVKECEHFVKLNSTDKEREQGFIVDVDDEDVVSRKKVNEALNAYQHILTTLLRECEGKAIKPRPFKLYADVAMRVKEQGKYVNTSKQIGPVAGVKVGDVFHCRAQLVIVGLHHPYQNGIDYMKKNGKIVATSIVDSGRYDSHSKYSDILIYTGEGGNPINRSEEPKDQKLERGNLALKNSMDEGTPVRVIRKRMEAGTSKSSLMTYVYEGLYAVIGVQQERESLGNLVFKFSLKRISSQEKVTGGKFLDQTSRSIVSPAGVCRNDISEGKEKMPIRAVNEIDNESPPFFNYLCNTIYPSFFKVSTQRGCDCPNGCLESNACPCVMKNGGVLPYDNKGRRTNRNSLVYECGPLCKCSSSCKNRTSQHGIRFKLEVFKSKSNGWGVRSHSYIQEGSFVCEHIGEIVEDEDGLVISSAQHGNVGRFINHSSSPNLVAQSVLYDHDDLRMPHIMLFAKKSIAPKQELTCGYRSSFSKFVV